MDIIGGGAKIQPIGIEIKNFPTHYCSIEEEENSNPWYPDIKRFIQHQKYPSGASKIDKKTLRRMAMEYYIDREILYRRSFDGTLLRCLSDLEANKALQEVHEGICVIHKNGHMMARDNLNSSFALSLACKNFTCSLNSSSQPTLFLQMPTNLKASSMLVTPLLHHSGYVSLTVGFLDPFSFFISNKDFQSRLIFSSISMVPLYRPW